MSKNLLFIASGGRTGTAFFGDRLSDVVEDCWSEHEPDLLATDWRLALPRVRKFGLWHMFFGRLLGQSGLRVIGHAYMAGKISADEAIGRLRAQRAKYHASFDETLIAESNFRYWMLAPLIAQAFEGSRTIGVIRDPRNWITSWIKHRPNRHTKSFLGWFPQGPMTPADVGDTDWIVPWGNLDQFSRLAWDWRIITQQLERAEADAKSGNTRIFRFEDMFGDDGGTMEELLRFASFDGKFAVGTLDGFRSNIRNASAGPSKNWREWSDEHVGLVDAMCGEQMRRHGYGLEDEWLERVARIKQTTARQMGST